MNLLQKIRNSFTSTDETVPAAASFATRPDTIYAPISGMLVSMPEINDEIISSGLLGDGYGILPVGNVIYAPATGRIDTVTVTNHAIGVLTPAGHEILIHVGIDTVKMEGKASSASSRPATRSSPGSRCSRSTPPPSPRPATRTW